MKFDEISKLVEEDEKLEGCHSDYVIATYKSLLFIRQIVERLESDFESEAISETEMMARRKIFAREYRWFREFCGREEQKIRILHENQRRVIAIEMLDRKAREERNGLALEMSRLCCGLLKGE